MCILGKSLLLYGCQSSIVSVYEEKDFQSALALRTRKYSLGFSSSYKKITILGKYIIFCLWIERSVGIEGQGESGCFKVFLKILNLHILGLHFSVELLNLNVSVTGKGSLIYQSKKNLSQRIFLFGFQILVLKQQKQQNRLKTNVLSTLNDP